MKKLVFFVLCMLAVLPLAFGANVIKKKGMDQGTLVQVLKSHETQINKMQTDIGAAGSNGGEDIMFLIGQAGVFQPNGALLSSPGLDKGSDTKKFKTQNTINYTIGGAYYYKAPTDDWCDFSGEATLALATGRFNTYAIEIQDDGSCEINAGDPQTSAALNDSHNLAGGGVALGDGIVVSVIQIGAAGSDHNFGTEDLDADGLTYLEPNALSSVIFDGNILTPTTASFSATASNVGTGTESDPKVDTSLDV